MDNSRHNPTLREQLDAVRPDSDDLANAELQEAARTIEESDEWRDIFDRQQDFDRHMTDALQDVDLPVGTQDRLLSTLAAAREAAEQGTPQESPPATIVSPALETAPRRGRRELTYAVSTVIGIAACLGVGFLFWTGGSTQLSLDEIRERIPLTANQRIDVTALAPFDESFDLSLPRGRWDRVDFDDPGGLDCNRDGRHDAAIIAFQTGGGRPVSGYLMIIPASAVSDPPTSILLSSAGVSYSPLHNTAWTSSDDTLVYVCFVDANDLRRLQRILYPQSA